MKSFCFVLLASAFVAISSAATPDCGPHGKYLTCGSCNATCADPLPRCDRSSCQPAGCYCDYPWVWSGGECVFPTECPKLGECGPNEDYYAAHCEATCEQPSPFCTSAQKTSGCQCKDGFVRSNGKCIRQSQCPAKPSVQCGPNAKFYPDCGTCNFTCAQTEHICHRFCYESGCYCLEGFFSHNGECIAANQCPNAQNQCGANEVHLGDGEGDCERTCEHPDVVVCTKHFFPEGCYCKPGTLRHEGKCIARSQCPAKHQCGANEEWKEFNEADCEGSCEDPNPFLCNRNFKPEGCYCKEGFVREDGKCIRPAQCPRKTPLPTRAPVHCGANAKFLTCGVCNGTCEQPLPSCDRMCQSAGCYCDWGFVSHNGACIAEAQCSKSDQHTCGANEEWKEFNEADCEGSCEDPNPFFCNRDFKPEGCYCKEGFVREDGKCIAPSQCPAKKEECGPNAVFLTCGTSNATCQQPFPSYTNTCNSAGCYCSFGFVSYKGACILSNACHESTWSLF